MGLERMIERMIGRMIPVLIAIAIIAVITVPVSAYEINPTGARDGVLLYMENRWDAWYLSTYPGYGADAVIYVAQINKIENKRSKSNIAGEIRSHALGYLAFGDREPQNPMNIVLNQPDSWQYHLLD